MLYKGDNVYTVGLTGMSGAGKTTACNIFAQSGFEIVNCDEVARTVVKCGKPALAVIAEYFGKDILREDGTLDRGKLGGIVFSDAGKLKALNDIIYPFITFEIISRIVRCTSESRRLVLLDAPTLFESGADALCDSIVCVTAEKEACAQRIMTRDGITREQAEKRLGSQHDASFYIERSHYSAVNCGSLSEFEGELRVIVGKICADALEERV